MLGAKALARAKINLFLEVGPSRSDGFHEVRSVMQTLDLSDELYFRRTDGSLGRAVIRCNEASVPTGEANLVSMAVEVFERETGVMKGGGVEVFINKKIPVGAGLAGGSADAAAALLAMNHTYEVDLSEEDMLSMAEQVGSDVPFCLKGGTALATGRGEKLQALQPLPQFQVVIASTGGEVSTAEVYARLDSLRVQGDSRAFEESEEAFRLLMEGIDKRDFESIYANLHNCLESATISTGQIEELKNIAEKAGANAASMSGSGPTVFALVSGMEQAAEVAWELEKIAPITIVTCFCERGAEVLT